MSASYLSPQPRRCRNVGRSQCRWRHTFRLRAGNEEESVKRRLNAAPSFDFSDQTGVGGREKKKIYMYLHHKTQNKITTPLIALLTFLRISGSWSILLGVAIVIETMTRPCRADATSASTKPLQTSKMASQCNARVSTLCCC